MVAAQAHRGPDAHGTYFSATGWASLGHNRLSILDLSAAGRQPMCSPDGKLWLVFNGEIYNYLELRSELSGYPFRTRTDTEVILAAYQKWGAACLDHFVGMFAFLLWDETEQKLFAARDRFGIKPLNYSVAADGTLTIASEIKALHAAGLPKEPDPVAWATFLSSGLYEHTSRTFWKNISSLPPGHVLTWQDSRCRIQRWYDLPDKTGMEFDTRPVEVVQEEYLALLKESVAFRFRSDVPVAINLSGGLDSSTLLALVHAVQGKESAVHAYTFVTGDPNYDELEWVQLMLRKTSHPLRPVQLNPDEVPQLAQSIQGAEDEPYGGLPTIAYGKLFQAARQDGVVVLLDGQGMDEQWAGYDYYLSALDDKAAPAGTVQGAKDKASRPECLTREFAALAEPFKAPSPYPDKLRNLQYRDIRYTKIPRALRFNDRVSMRSSTELREPFLDHRLFELALRQPVEHKIVNGTRKWLLRQIATRYLPNQLSETPKRPLQTPQREWLRGPLQPWANQCIEQMLASDFGQWFKPELVREEWRAYCAGQGDNSVFVWQWISLGMMTGRS